MDKDAYIEQLESENAALKQRIKTLEKRLEKMEKNVQELERRLGMNSQNSSKPPSSDPPGTPVGLPRRGGKKRGARKGHPPHLRSLLPPEKVTRRIEPVLDTCRKQGRSAWQFLQNALSAYYFQTPTPSLLPQT